MVANRVNVLFKRGDAESDLEEVAHEDSEELVRESPSSYADIKK